MNTILSQKGRVVIPPMLRKKYGLKPGARMQFVDYDGVLALVPARNNPIEDTAGMLKGGDSLTEALLVEHRREIENEH